MLASETDVHHSGIGEDDDMRKRLLLGGLAILLMACNALLVAQPGTATPIPSVTSEPTLTHTPTLAAITPSATATLEVTVTVLPEGSARPELACKVLSQSVVNGSKFASRERFDITWVVQNTGTATWEPGVVEFAYAGGRKMYQYQPVPLTHSSPPGDITTLSAVMVAPTTPERYTTVWALRRGDQYFCKVSVSIKVHL
jgi:hypothetical protein